MCFFLKLVFTLRECVCVVISVLGVVVRNFIAFFYFLVFFLSNLLPSLSSTLPVAVARGHKMKQAKESAEYAVKRLNSRSTG